MFICDMLRGTLGDLYGGMRKSKVAIQKTDSHARDCKLKRSHPAALQLTCRSRLLAHTNYPRRVRKSRSKRWRRG
jgi:hypothetical protein